MDFYIRISIQEDTAWDTLFELGALQAANLRINRYASKPLHILANDTMVCCRVAIWDADTVFITLTVFPKGLDNHFNQLGPRVPGYCTGLGKAILAHMSADKVKAYLDKTTLSPFTRYTITDPDKLLADLEESWVPERINFLKSQIKSGYFY